MADTINIYEPLDLKLPVIPPRSRLFHLEPIGICTPYVESLTSYINRLARAHCVRPRKLITQEMQPLLRISTAITGNNGPWESLSFEMLNGMTPLVGEWIQVLSQLTGREDLQFLSMLTWTNIADQKGVVRSTRAWCAACYDEWLRAGQVIYEPLLWNVKAVTRCPLHHLDLLDRCPQQDCRQPIPLLIDRSLPHQCPSCGSSLAIPASKITMSGPLTDKPGVDIQQWNANATAALLSAAPMLSTLPSRHRVAAGITAYITNTVSGGDAVLASKLGINKSALMSWQRGLSLPRFNTLLMMCFYMNISPLLFLTDDVESFLLTQSPVQVNGILKATQKSGPVNIEQLEKALTEILREDPRSAPPLYAVARKLGYPRSTLRYYFPEQCQAITERYQQRNNTDYRQALEGFLVNDERPTLKEIARRLGCSLSVLRHRYPDLCRAITGQNRRVFDFGKIHEALLEALRCEECSFPTVSEISKRFECSQSVLYNHFPELCKELTKKHKGNRPGVRSSEKTARDLNMSEVEAISDKPKRMRKIFGKEDIDRMRKELEYLLENGNEWPLTMSKLAQHTGWSAKSLRDYFPDLCDKIIKKREKEEHLNKLKQALEEVLMGSGAPSVNQLARQLGCSRAILRSHFPDLCTLISQRYRGLRDIEMQRKLLEEIIRSGANLSVNEIARRLGCNSMTLHNRFPDLCKTLIKRRRQTVDIVGMQKGLEAALANDEEPPPTLHSLSKVLGCSAHHLVYHFPEASRAITERWRRLSGLGRFRQRLEEMLASDDPISVQTAATRLGCSASSLRNRFPEPCKSISMRYLAHRKNRIIGEVEEICNEVREIVFDLHAHGEYPAQEKVQGLVSKPSYFWYVKVRETWRNTLRELGLSD